MELVTALRRQYRLRRLELAALAAAEGERPPTEATSKRLVTFARYGARIDKDIAKALQALRALRNWPDAWIGDAARDGTSEPEPAPTEPPLPAEPAAAQGDRAIASLRRTCEPCLVDLWHGGGHPPRARGGRAGSEIDPNPGC